MTSPFIFLFPILLSFVGAFIFIIDTIGKDKDTKVKKLLADLFVHAFAGSIIGSLMIFKGLPLALCCIASALGGYIGRVLLKIMGTLMIQFVLKFGTVFFEQMKQLGENLKKDNDDKIV